MVSTSASPSSLNRKPSMRELHRSTVTLKVGKGQDQDTFIVHKELLLHHSKYFRDLLDATIKRDSDGVIELPHISAKRFSAFECWLYGKELCPEDEESQDHFFISCIFLYILAESLGAPGFQNALMNLIHKTRVLQGPSVRRIDRLFVQNVSAFWETIMEDSPLRRVVVEQIATMLDTRTLVRTYGSNVPKAALLKVLELLVQRLEGSTDEWAPFKEGVEAYYVKESE
ncbi:hypothetical protein MMC13_005329 [Lambiella insularis]|nr:hypothetical protein [Lambiella insularis]